MHDNCPNCGQLTELEPGFYYGTGYVSYGLSMALSIALFIAYYTLGNFSWYDNSVFIFLAVDIGAVLLLQPWIMRLSRSLYLHFFVKHDPEA